MPTEYRVSGPPLIRDNRPIEPMAPIYFCEGCGFEGAPFGIHQGDRVLSYCGYRDGQPTCVGKGRKAPG